MSTHSICMNAWKLDEDGDQHYCDFEEETPDGWNIYARTPSDEPGMFDIPVDVDVPTYEEAHYIASYLMAFYGADDFLLF